jgi:flagellar biosynthesis protein FlhG
MVAKVNRLWSFGSAGGGVGKSLLTALMALELARRGKSVAAVDANTSSPDLQGLLGAQPHCLGLLDLWQGRATLEEISHFTCEPRLRLLSLAGERLDGNDQILKNPALVPDLIRSLEEEYILVDLKAGTAPDVLDIFNGSHRAVLIATSSPASIQSAHRFLKAALYRRIAADPKTSASLEAALRELHSPARRMEPTAVKTLLERIAASDTEASLSISEWKRDFKPSILLNMTSSGDGAKAAATLESAAREDLNLTLCHCGAVNFLDMPASFKEATDLPANSLTGTGIGRALQKLLEEAAPRRQAGQAAPPVTAPLMGFNDILTFMGKELHIQTEDSGNGEGGVITQVFCNGRVIMSTRSDYPSSRDAGKSDDEIMELMRNQHYQVLRQIEDKRARVQATGYRS